MKYIHHKLDNRFSYKKWFDHYIGFSSSMSNAQGPLHFNTAMQWFVATYGWSAEVRQYDNMVQWVSTSAMIGRTVNLKNMPHLASGVLTDVPDICNPHWSWTNHYDDLRIYVASDKELMMFQLTHPVTQS